MIVTNSGGGAPIRAATPGAARSAGASSGHFGAALALGEPNPFPPFNCRQIRSST